jgi:2-methylcitrate dehydratase
MPTIAAAEYAQAGGRDLVAAVVLAYEVFLSFSNVFKNNGFDDTNFGCLATAISAARLWKLTPEQTAHAIAMAVVPNVALKQVRTDELTAWKVMATGHAGRAGLFAAMLARQGLEGPNLPFEGKAGWLDHVARERFALPAMGGAGTPFKILDTRIKMRPCAGETISSVLAAEKLHGKVGDIRAVKSVHVALYKRAVERAATGEHHWSPKGRDAAANAIPYLIATAMMEGSIGLDSFDEAHLKNPDTKDLMRKIKVVENPEFTKTYPADHRTRITVTTGEGREAVGESGGGEDDLSSRKTQAQIADKFRGLTANFLGAQRANAVLERIWRIEDLGNVATLISDFAPAK